MSFRLPLTRLGEPGGSGREHLYSQLSSYFKAALAPAPRRRRRSRLATAIEAVEGRVYPATLAPAALQSVEEPTAEESTESALAIAAVQSQLEQAAADGVSLPRAELPLAPNQPAIAAVLSGSTEAGLGESAPSIDWSVTVSELTVTPAVAPSPAEEFAVRLDTTADSLTLQIGFRLLTRDAAGAAVIVAGRGTSKPQLILPNPEPEPVVPPAQSERPWTDPRFVGPETAPVDVQPQPLPVEAPALGTSEPVPSPPGVHAPSANRTEPLDDVGTAPGGWIDIGEGFSPKDSPATPGTGVDTFAEPAAGEPEGFGGLESLTQPARTVAETAPPASPQEPGGFVELPFVDVQTTWQRQSRMDSARRRERASEVNASIGRLVVFESADDSATRLGGRSTLGDMGSKSRNSIATVGLLDDGSPAADSRGPEGGAGLFRSLLASHQLKHTIAGYLSFLIGKR